MSKGEIVSSKGEGQYIVRQQFAVDKIQEQIGVLVAKIIKLDAALPIARVELLDAEGEAEIVVSKISAEIPGIMEGDKQARAEAVRLQSSLANIQANIAKIKLKVFDIEAGRLGALKQKRRLESVPVEKEIEAWCADYTDDLSGTVGLADINDEGGGGVVIHPGYNGAASYNAERDGELFPNEAQSGTQIYLNEALKPGAQKWKPRYRKGQILLIYGDVCSVKLEDAKSSAQNLNINKDDYLRDIPIQYMDCNGEAFEVGDWVLVRFFQSGPQVVGFANEPKPCGIDLVWQSMELVDERYANNTYLLRTARISASNVEVATSPSSSNIRSLSLFDKAIYFSREFPGGGLVPAPGGGSLPMGFSSAQFCAVKNAISEQKEVWVMASYQREFGSEITQRILIYLIGGGITREIVLGVATQEGWGMAVSPHYYAFFTEGTTAEVRRIFDDSAVIQIPWHPRRDEHYNYTHGLVDVTDELFVWTDFIDVFCKLVPSGLDVPLSVDYLYLKRDYRSWPLGNVVINYHGIMSVKLSNRTLTVIGSSRLIHYRINRDANGMPIGFSEILRYQYSEHPNHHVRTSTDRSKLKAIPPP